MDPIGCALEVMSAINFCTSPFNISNVSKKEEKKEKKRAREKQRKRGERGTRKGEGEGKFVAGVVAEGSAVDYLGAE